MTLTVETPSDTLGLRSSGPSPGTGPGTEPGSTRAPAGAAEPAPRVHLFGPGAVGRAFLRLCARDGVPVVAVTDSGATVYARGGLDALAIAAHKERGGSLADLPGSERLPSEAALDLVPCDVVAEAGPSDPREAAHALARVQVALRAGARVALASKCALALASRRLLTWGGGSRVGANAALGGTGRHLTRELAELSAGCSEVALVANATSGVVLDALARGATFQEGLDAARAAGLLEGDPSADLDGTDAALKLAIVAGALWGASVDARAIERTDLRRADARRVWLAHTGGRVTRLVARAARDGRASVALEELPAGSPLAAPAGSVAYGYRLAGGRLRVHLGRSLGAEATARALLDDVRALAAVPTAGGAR